MDGMANTKDREVINIVLFAFWALIEALQLLVIVVFIFSFIPFKPNPFVQTLFPLHQKGVLPEREMLFYRIFVFGAIGLQAAALTVFRRRLGEDHLSKGIIALTLANVFWLFVELFAVFKMIVVGNPDWARYLFYAGLAGAVVTRVFWPEVKTWSCVIWRNVLQHESTTSLLRTFDAGMALLVVLLMFIPDLTKVMARIWVSDQFEHIDSLLAAPGWAHLNGLVLNRDVTSEYSVVIPVVISHAAQLLGGFTYHNLIVVVIGITMAYFIGFYVLLRRWLGSALVAAFGVLLAIKLQMFHWGVAPIIWRFPSATVLRYAFDLTALYLIWRHCVTLDRRYLWGAAVICGWALAYMLDTGLYLTVAFYVYLLALLCHPLWRRESFASHRTSTVAGLLVLPVVTGFIVLALFQGPVILSREFWANTFEFAALFLQGWGALPMFDGLKERQFFAFIMGFVIPLVYVWTMIVVAAACFLGQAHRRNLFVAIMCVYGLGLYHYFINRSAVTSYYVVCIPFVSVVCFWLTRLYTLLEAHIQRALKLVALCAMVGALLTSYLFTFYPNVLHPGNEAWAQEIQLYKNEFDVRDDARLIAGLTKPDDRVALVSSFETALLMEAGRKPFFYYFPLLESSPMRFAQFRGTYLHTFARMQKTLDELESKKPAYVFIERKLFLHQIRPEYYQYYQTLSILVDYLTRNYQIAQEGRYLVALKHK